MSTVIKVENVSKRYQLGSKECKRDTLREVIVDTLKAPFKRINSLSNGGVDEFWALRDVSFDVQEGDVVGIIGRNGAGKSTLLKILSKITEPTSGRVKIKGRVASLLEVGTGFHPELSGRENIYLNGAILGMSRVEINNKFDEIVAFSEIEKFLDTPVKRYSSGMYVRLAFAVAAHLAPEILIVDEVLAVGDAQFQKKCLGKMGEVRKEGRTIIFVSHNLAAVTSLCNRGIFLCNGKIQSDGFISDVAMNYLNDGKDVGCCRRWENPMDAPGDNTIRLKGVRLISEGTISSDVSIDKDIFVEVEYWNLKAGAEITASIHLFDKNGVGVLASANMRSATLNEDEWFGKPHPLGIFKTRCKLPANFLNEGTYYINVIVLTDTTTIHVKADEVVTFNAHDTGAMRKEYKGEWLGVVRPKLEWNTELIESEGLSL